MGLEVVKDKETKSSFPSELNLAATIKAAAFEEGLICYPMSGTRDGKLGDHILLAPPFIISDSQISELVEKLSLTINTACPK